MSLRTWKKEFYHVSARRIKNDKDALKHALLKWKGLRSENLEKHGLEKWYSCIKEKKNQYNEFFIDSANCSLCVLHKGCTSCPLLGYGSKGCGSSFCLWVAVNNPEPMIKLIETTINKRKRKK
jgi:hypothetical protein